MRQEAVAVLALAGLSVSLHAQTPYSGHGAGSIPPEPDVSGRDGEGEGPVGAGPVEKPQVTGLLAECEMHRKSARGHNLVTSVRTRGHKDLEHPATVQRLVRQ